MTLRLAALFLLGTAVGCTTDHVVHLTDSASKTELLGTIAYAGSGDIQLQVIGASGQKMFGELRPSDSGTFRTTSGQAAGAFDSELKWASDQGLTVADGEKSIASGMVAGDGASMEVALQYDHLTGHGHGVGRDKQGRHYVIRF